MPSARLLLSAALLVALVGAAGALAWWSGAGEGESGSYPVSIIGPEGTLFEGIVRVENATALSALQAAAASAGLGIEMETYPGMGVYVRAIGGIRAEGPSGWVYEVREGDAWVSGDRSAAHRPLREGEALRWSWTPG